MFNFPDAGIMNNYKFIELIFKDKTIKPIRIKGPFTRPDSNNTTIIQGENVAVILNADSILLAKLYK